MNKKTIRNPTGGGRANAHDWALLVAQFDADWAPHGRTLREFCESREVPLPYQLTSAAFIRERKRSSLGTIHSRNLPLGIVAQRRVSEALARMSVEAGPVKAGEFALKVLAQVMEREEPNATLAQQINIVIPPLFPESEAARRATKALMEGK
jgi:hypothetical protein